MFFLAPVLGIPKVRPKHTVPATGAPNKKIPRMGNWFWFKFNCFVEQSTFDSRPIHGKECSQRMAAARDGRPPAVHVDMIGGRSLSLWGLGGRTSRDSTPWPGKHCFARHFYSILKTFMSFLVFKILWKCDEVILRMGNFSFEVSLFILSCEAWISEVEALLFFVQHRTTTFFLKSNTFLKSDSNRMFKSGGRGWVRNHNNTHAVFQVVLLACEKVWEEGWCLVALPNSVNVVHLGDSQLHLPSLVVKHSLLVWFTA